MDVLIVAIEQGRSGPARLPQNLSAMGLRVASLCPPASDLAHSGFNHRFLPLPASRSWRRLGRAIDNAIVSTAARLVVPADEQVVALLHFLMQRGGPLSDAARGVVERSLGHPAAYEDVLYKSATLALARRLALPAPRSITCTTREEAEAAAIELGYPAIVKQAFCWAGQGVHRADDAAALAAIVGRMPRPDRPWRAVLRRVLARDWYPARPEFDIQEFVPGQPAMYCALAWQGRLVGGFAARPLVTAGAFGPSRAVNLCHDADMETTCARFIARTGITGFIGFDFMLPEAGGPPLLIECNPRPIQVTHLGYRIGVDLAAALRDRMDGLPLPPAPLRPRSELAVALYPNTTATDDVPQMLDIPGRDPGLLRFWQDRNRAAPA